MPKSAGILLYRYRGEVVEFFIVHPGGPFWKNKDAGAWSIPKGEFEEGEDPLKAAQREFEEETGVRAEGDFITLAPVRQRSGKIVYAWGLNSDIEAGTIRSNTFSLEWPPKSKKFIEVPEVDRAGWFSFEEAKVKLNPGQVPILDELFSLVKE
jgi:predicted NUDIX family NTP pyrophosphohydrolase